MRLAVTIHQVDEQGEYNRLGSIQIAPIAPAKDGIADYVARWIEEPLQPLAPMFMLPRHDERKGPLPLIERAVAEIADAARRKR